MGGGVRDHMALTGCLEEIGCCGLHRTVRGSDRPHLGGLAGANRQTAQKSPSGPVRAGVSRRRSVLNV